MKTVNGGLMIILAFFVLWIGVTGRFPKLIEAIGLVRGNAPETPSKSGGITSNTGSVPLSSPLSFTPVPLTKPNPSTVDLLNAPLGDLWANALKSWSAPAAPK